MLNNAGSFISQELGFALAWGNEWLAALTGSKVCRSTEVAKRVKFNFRYIVQLFYGACQIPGCSYVVGSNCETI